MKKISNGLNKKTKIYFIAIIFISIFIFSAKIIFASDALKINLEFPIPGMENGINDFGEYLLLLYNYFIYISGILAVIMIMVAGFGWVTAGGNQSKIGEAKTRIVGALTGLFLVFGSYLILNTINPKLTLLQVPHVTDINVEYVIDAETMKYMADMNSVDKLNITCSTNSECQQQNAEWACINNKCLKKSLLNNSCDETADCYDKLTCVGGSCKNLTCNLSGNKPWGVCYIIALGNLGRGGSDPGYCSTNEKDLAVSGETARRCFSCRKRGEICMHNEECVGPNGKCGEGQGGNCLHGILGFGGRTAECK